MMKRSISQCKGFESVQEFIMPPVSLHDGEVISLCLSNENAHSSAQIIIRLPLLDAEACVISIFMAGITQIELNGWQAKNYLQQMLFEETAEAFVLELEPIWGLGGKISCAQLSFDCHLEEPEQN